MASLIENMAPEYTTDGAKAGNYYMHSKLLYLCKSDCSGLFDESNFEQVYLSDLLRGTANSNLGNKENLNISYEVYAYNNTHLIVYPFYKNDTLTVGKNITKQGMSSYINVEIKNFQSETIYSKQTTSDTTSDTFQIVLKELNLENPATIVIAFITLGYGVNQVGCDFFARTE